MNDSNDNNSHAKFNKKCLNMESDCKRSSTRLKSFFFPLSIQATAQQLNMFLWQVQTIFVTNSINIDEIKKATKSLSYSLNKQPFVVMDFKCIFNSKRQFCSP